jgi:hypothetical protein
MSQKYGIENIIILCVCVGYMGSPDMTSIFFNSCRLLYSRYFKAITSFNKVFCCLFCSLRHSENILFVSLILLICQIEQTNFAFLYSNYWIPSLSCDNIKDNVKVEPKTSSPII